METTCLKQWGNSQAIRIPQIILNSLSWNKDESLNIFVNENKIIIEPKHDKEAAFKHFLEGIDELSGDFMINGREQGIQIEREW